ncbi:MAG: hypothetical protein IPI42_06585 [Saprospiraceae bacterium]|nr:hypothetical protein [Candidatus Parvibacillus calidus]
MISRAVFPSCLARIGVTIESYPGDEFFYLDFSFLYQKGQMMLNGPGSQVSSTWQGS